MSETTQRNLNLFSPQTRANPYPIYAELRKEAPVYPIQGQSGRRMWIVTRYEDVQTVLKDPRFIKNVREVATGEELAAIDANLQSSAFRLLNYHLLNADPPDHTRLRSLITKTFTPRRVELLRPRIEQLTDELIDAMEGKTEVDLIDAFAFPLPIRVISELMGLPIADRHKFREWTSMIVDRAGTEAPEVNQRKGTQAFVSYLTQLVVERRNQPMSSDSDESKDLVTALIQTEEQGDKLSEEELISMLWILILAGHETTVNLIGNGMLALFQHPDQMEKLKDNPELIKTAIEEFLRYNGPVEAATLRYASENLELDGQKISRGDALWAALAGADRDPSEFANSDDLDVTRTNNQHLAFGYGIHYCVGAPLARLEGQIAFRKLLERKPTIHLAVPAEQLTWRPNMILHGLQSLPVAF